MNDKRRRGFWGTLGCLVGRVRFWFLETFGVRDIERTPPAHGDWTETCGWHFRKRFYPCDKMPNSMNSMTSGGEKGRADK